MKKISKKMLLSIIAGALVTVAVIGAATYAWFSGGATIAEGEFHTAIVKLGDTEGRFGVYNFLTGHAMNGAYQYALERADEQFFASWLTAVNPGNQLMKEDYDEFNGDLAELAEQIREAGIVFAAAYQEWLDALALYDGLAGPYWDLVSNPPAVPVMPDIWDFVDHWNIIYHPITGVEIARTPVFDNAAFNAAVAQYAAEMNYLVNIYPAIVEAALAELTDAYWDARDKETMQEGLANALNDLRIASQELLDFILGSAVFELVPNDRVTPGALIYGTFSIVNESNVPTYFRLTETSDVSDIAMVKAVAFNGQYTFQLVPFIDDDGVLSFYSPNALPAGQSITLVIGAYIYGEANPGFNGAPVQDTPFNFGGAQVDLIQASNNAVYLADGWAEAAQVVHFLPYSE